MYPIYKYKSRRPITDYIILTHSVNLINKNIYIDPIVLRGNYKYTFGIWQEYLIHDLHFRDLPFHYFVELLDKDYVIYKGCSDDKESLYIKQLVKNGIIDYYYKNSVLIVLQDNLKHEIPDPRMWDHINSKLVPELIRRYQLDSTRIKILDECLSKNWEENLKNSPLKYEFTPHSLYNDVIYRMSLMKYLKY